MISPERREVLRQLEELSDACPEYRFGQMIANLALLARGESDGAIWEMEDEEWIAAALNYLTQWKERHAPVA